MCNQTYCSEVYTFFSSTFLSIGMTINSIKSSINEDSLNNYRPNFYMSFLSELTEPVVKQLLTHHLSSNGLLNSFQSAYNKHHSTESILISVHDHIIKDMSQQQITALCFLDLSAGTDSINPFYSCSPSILMVCLKRDYSLLASILSLFTQFRCQS